MSTSGISVIRVDMATVATSATDTFEAFMAPLEIVEGELVRAYFANAATIAGDSSVYTTIDVFNATSSVAMAALTSQSSIPADTPTALTNSATALNKRFKGGDRIQIRKSNTGAGPAITAPCAVILQVKLESTYDS